MTSAIRVVVVDDHDLFRDGVIAALRGTGTGTATGDSPIDVVGVADDVATAVEVIDRERPDVVLLDVHLTSGSGAEVITARPPTTSGDGLRYLAISVSDAPEDVMALVRAGAQGYVTKRIDTAELVDAIGHVAVGNAVFSPRLAAFVLEALRRSGPATEERPEELDRLTGREQEVMRLLARGFTYKEIATELFISDRTVESHTSAVLRKLQLSSRNELAHWAARHDLL